ncbi:FAD-dependent monooxygenase [Smaragdicoccus niigatensis]|uniref:FAD-dependent monooxygenase n=1 Tax=Smaragdicoccus niigatensis TaxID=359359 RepID=UPI00036121F3|nr:FAD-dependent monooxygenase [Smaragdicoccus niigatensis]
MTDNLDVLIVGAGPTGLTLACDLVRRGLNIRIIDHAETGFPGSRAKGVQPRTLEVFHDLGVLDDLVEHSTTYPLLGLHIGPLTIPWTMMGRHRATEDVPYPNTLLVPQYDTDACLRRRLDALGGHVEYRTRLTSCTDDGTGVTAVIDGPNGPETVHARFLFGADGGSSRVRQQAGIPFVGETDESDKMIVADVLVDGLGPNRWHIWPRNGGRFMALCPLPDGKFQLMLRLKHSESAELEPGAIERLVQQAAENAGLQIRKIYWSSVFRPNVRLAEHYRSGNIFLAGDAAHVHTPAGAQGLNTGVQDAYNLGWKLGQVIAGAPEALLDSYEAERRPVAARVLGLSSALYQGLTDRPLAAAKRGDEERQLLLNYRGGPLAAEPSDRAVQTGDRAPDAKYRDIDGQSGRLFDRFRGPHFTLVAIGDAAIAGAATTDWPAGGASLHTVRIPTSAARGLQRIYGIEGPAQILVRPDGYIAYIATGDWESALKARAHGLAPRITA